MLHTVIGPKRNAPAVDRLIAVLRPQPLSGTLYVGYPVLPLAEGPTTVDALLTCAEHGVVIFDLPGPDDDTSPEGVRERQDELHAAMSATLLTSPALRPGRQLAVPLHVVTVLPPQGPRGPGRTPAGTRAPASPGVTVTTVDRVADTLLPLAGVDHALLPHVDETVQRMVALRPRVRRRTEPSSPTSRGAVARRIEREVANLDRYQNAAAIETPDGPQRIRGLAGSGKTVVLALKAAFLHAHRPDARIALTFHTRTLYQHVSSLVERFYRLQTGEAPDWERLQVMHAWGAHDRPGFYTRVAAHVGVGRRTFSDAKGRYGRDGALGGVCAELLAVLTDGREIPPLFDIVLIDEAQDLPQSFFEVAYLVTNTPKRVVWAYDELQNLTGENAVPPVAALFGKRTDGRPRVARLRNREGAPKEDVMLPVCYRNTPWALTVAHALGFGVYRVGGLVQFFDKPQSWNDIGYELVAGDLKPGHQATVARAAETMPHYVDELFTESDAVTYQAFRDFDEQIAWVAAEIRTNIAADELAARDVLVVVATQYSVDRVAALLAQALRPYGLSAHVGGVSTGQDAIFSDDPRSIAVAAIHRAKGHEAPMVYVLNAENGVGPGSQIQRRNMLFTAISRSRGWVRICGCGPGMALLAAEVDQVVANEYRLAFLVPTEDELRHMRKINRDMTSDEQARVKTGQDMLAALASEDDAVVDAVLSRLDAGQRAKVLRALREAYGRPAKRGQEGQRGSS